MGRWACLWKSAKKQRRKAEGCQHLGRSAQELKKRLTERKKGSERAGREKIKKGESWVGVPTPAFQRLRGAE